MIVISPLRTRRISARLKEMTIGDAMHLCKMSPTAYEAGTAELLKRIVESDPTPRVGQVTDMRLWSVQERAFVVAHYISQTADGDPNFELGDGRYFDYLMEMDKLDSPVAEFELGELEGDKWVLRPLLGAHAEAIERLVIGGQLEASRSGWWFGAMAAQLVRPGEDVPDVATCSDDELERFILARAFTLYGFPESSLMQLLFLYLDGIEKTNHIFRLSFSDFGIEFLPAIEDKEGPGDVPARFPFTSAVSEPARTVFGKPE